MCGIVGAFSRMEPQHAWPREVMESCLERLAHRGPDGSHMSVEPGLFLGHTRLAVLDLSQAGRQPMSTPDGRYSVVYNGEIYNFRELRATLEGLGHAFATGTDTEALLAAWAQWGPDCLARLDGIFAFGLFDRREKKLHLVRDHFGVKPLYYHDDGRVLAFASEPFALLGTLLPTPEPDPRDLDFYFTFNYMPAPCSGLTGLRQLPPACHLQAGEDGLRMARFWRLEAADVPSDEAAALEGLGELLDRAASAQTASDAPLGVFLSGGLDSLAVAEAVSRAAGIKPEAFTLGFAQSRFDETRAAAEHAEHLGLSNAARRFDDGPECMAQTMRAMTCLHMDASNFPMHQLCGFARKSVTVALGGDGGDELLAGYDTYRAGEFTGLAGALPAPVLGLMARAARLLPAGNRAYGLDMVAGRFLDAAAEGPGRDHCSFRRIFAPALKRELYSRDFQRLARGFDPVGEYAALLDRDGLPPASLKARQIADLTFHLPSILTKVDMMSMAHGLEVRVPLLNPELAAYCLGLARSLKRKGSQGKLALRRALRNRVPPGALRLPKAGFLPPVDAWFMPGGALDQIFADLLDWAGPRLDWLRWDRAAALREAHRAGRVKEGFVLLGILQFMNWSRVCARA